MKKSDDKTLGQIIKHRFKGVVVGSEDSPFDRCVLVTDETLDPKNGKMIAVVLQSDGGNVVYWHKDGYDALEIMVNAEVDAFQTWRAGRHMEFRVEAKK